MEVFPNYYNKFKCIADKCKHSCCIGWEIDIDEDTAAVYSSLDTSLGDEIRANIAGDPPHFVLKEEERCPFLNKKGLCEIILQHGEDLLCDICALHPRFKNFYSSFEEVGLGLCCEEAVRVILSCEDKFFIEIPEDITDDEKEFFKIRREVFAILQDREKPMSTRILNLARKFEIDFDFKSDEIYNKLVSLERLDEKWEQELECIRAMEFDTRIFDEYPLEFEQLAIYFIFRHLSDAMWEEDYRATVNFTLVSCYVIGVLWSRYNTAEKRYDVVRMYSSEIEYSEENTEILKGWLYE